MKCTAEIAAGVCGFSTTVVAEAEEEQVALTLTTDCQKVQGLAESLRGRPVDAYDEIHRGHDGTIMTAVRAHLLGCCAGCAVPVGIFKAMQVAARVALPKDISITLRGE
jgi:hypothetical protein